MAKHAVVLRRYSSDLESNEYSCVDEAASLSAACKKAAHFRGKPGDILIVCDFAYVSDMQNHAKAIYAIDASGNVRKAPRLRGSIEHHETWLAAWEGPDAESDDMLRAAVLVGVDIKLVVLACCACVRSVIDIVPKEEATSIAAIKTAEACVRGETTSIQIESIKAAVCDDEKILSTNRMYSAASIAIAIKQILDIILHDPGFEETEDLASGVALKCAEARGYSAYYAATNQRSNAYGVELKKTIRELSEIVRRIIPLSVLITSRK